MITLSLIFTVNLNTFCWVFILWDCSVPRGFWDHFRSFSATISPRAYMYHWCIDPIFIWPTGIFLAWVSPSPHYILLGMTFQHYAYGTLGRIWADCSLFGLLSLTLHSASQDLGLFAHSAWLHELTVGTVLQCSGGSALWWKEKARERRRSGALWRIEAALLEARHRLCLTSLSLTDWWDYPDIFSFQLKLHYHKDLMLGRSPYYSWGDLGSILLCASFCSLLFFFLFQSHSEEWNLLYSLVCIIW